MKICEDHYAKLRHAINARGLGDFVSKDHREAFDRLRSDLEGKKQTRSNFDPLLTATNVIFKNSLEFMVKLGFDPIEILSADNSVPQESCPICYLNFKSAEHDRTCDDPHCSKDKGQTFDHWIDLAAGGVAEYLKTLPITR